MAKGAYIGVNGVARKIKKGYVGVHMTPTKQYALLKSIQSSGTQYIDTGFKPNQDTRTVMRVTVSQTGTEQYLFGVRMPETALYEFHRYSNKWSIGYRNRWTDYMTYSGAMPFTIDLNKNQCYFNGSLVGSGTYGTFTCDRPMFLFTCNGGSYTPITATVYECQIYDNGMLVRNFVPAKRLVDGAVGLYDRIGNAFYPNAGTGTFTAGAETGEYIYNVLQEGEYARRIKKAYIGVGGVARPCWSGGEIAYYGQISPISAGRMGVEAASSGKMLFAAGGATGFTVGATHYATVDAYSNQLVHSTAPNRAVAGYRMGAVSVNRKYALFAGGYNAAARASYSQVDAYNDAMTKTAATALSYAADRICGISMGAKGVFFGGIGGNHTSESPTNLTNIYTDTLTRSVGTSLTTSGHHTGGHAGAYAVVSPAGGTVDAFNDNMVKTTLGTVSAFTKAADSGSGVVFADQSLAFAFTETLTRVNVEALAGNRHYPSTACLDGIGIFAGGVTARGSATRVASVDGYKELTRMALPALQTARIDHFGGVVGDFALFGGGGTLTSTEAYTIV